MTSKVAHRPKHKKIFLINSDIKNSRLLGDEFYSNCKSRI